MAGQTLFNPHLEGGPFYWEAGPVGVFLSHGFTATCAEVRPLAKRLHSAGFTVAGPLLPGHGTFPKDLNQVRWQDWAQAGEETFQQLMAGCQQVFIGGESMGAVLALYLASQHPEASGVLAFAPAIKLNMSTSDSIRLRLLAPFVPWVPKKSLDGSAYWQGYPVNPLKGVMQLLYFQQEVLKRLPQVHQPLLVMQGRLDTTVHPTVGQIILDGVSSSGKELQWMEKSSHVVIIDQELDEVTRITLEFLNRNCEYTV
jgi:carboxylesterase